MDLHSTPMNRPTLLIFAQRGPVLESLCAFLKIANQAEIIAQVDTPSALTEALAGSRPDLVILDAGSLPSEGDQAVQEFRATWPGVRCLVLAESLPQLQAARAGGADEALLWGFSTEELAAAVRDLTGAAETFC